MTQTPIKISETARAMLIPARMREDRLVRPPTLLAGARLQVVRSLLNNGLVEEVAAPIDDAVFVWREAEDGTRLMLRATEQGLTALGEGAPALSGTVDQGQSLEAFTREVAAALEEQHCGAIAAEEPEARVMIHDGHANGRSAWLVAKDITAWLDEEDTAAYDAAGLGDDDEPADAAGETQAEAGAIADEMDAAPTANSKRCGNLALANAARAAVEAYKTADEAALSAAMETLAAALEDPPVKRATLPPRAPREGTKQQTVLTLLRRPEGATIAQIAEVTGWQTQTVRGFLAGLKKKSIEVEVLERVRQVGPNKQGAKGSYSVYRIAEAG